jgi:hypothetical protein
MDDFKGQMPAELKPAYYHQWGLKKQGAKLSEPEVRVDYYHVGLPSNSSAIHSYFGLHDMIKYLGHEKLDVIDIFKIDCEFNLEMQSCHESSSYYLFSHQILFGNRRRL